MSQVTGVPATTPKSRLQEPVNGAASSTIAPVGNAYDTLSAAAEAGGTFGDDTASLVSGGPSTLADDRASAITGATPSSPSRGPTAMFEHEVSPAEQAKWNEMVDIGIAAYVAMHPDRFHRRVRRGIPQRYRWQVWKARIGVDSSQYTAKYRSLCEPPNQWTNQIEIDIGRTFPELRGFDAENQQKLRRVLNAYAAYNPDVGYCQGMNFVAGLLLMVSGMQEEESFAVLARLMDSPDFGLAGFYRERLPLLRRYLRACERLVADTVPELHDHFVRENVQPAVYLHQWFLTLFINCFPLSMVMVIWDAIVCEGLPVILRIAVSILQVLKESLLNLHFEDIIKFFKMMKTEDHLDGKLNPFRIGQLLMKHTEHVQIPDHTLEYLGRDLAEDDGTWDCDENWEAELSSSTWWSSFSRMFTFGSSKRRVSTGSGGSGPAYARGPATDREAGTANTSAARRSADRASASYGGGYPGAAHAAPAVHSTPSRPAAAASARRSPGMTSPPQRPSAHGGTSAAPPRVPNPADADRKRPTAPPLLDEDEPEDSSLTEGWQFL